MKRRLLALALLGSTALTPAPAQAWPVLGFLQGLAAGIAGSAVIGGSLAVAGFGAGLSAYALVSTALGGILGRVLLSVGLSALSAALTPKPNIPSPGDQMQNWAQPLSYMRSIWGRSRTGGPLGFWGAMDWADTTVGNSARKRWFTPILCAHPIEGIVEHYLGEDRVTLDADGLVTSGDKAGHYRLMPFLGAPGQVANPTFVAAFSEVDASFDFKGLAGAHIWLARPADADYQKVIPTGRFAAWAPVLDGHNQVYDPRTDTRGFTRNAALILANWITEHLMRTVEWDAVAVEADICDEAVPVKQGGTVPRWQIGGVLDWGQEYESQRAQMAVACDAFVFQRPDGKMGFYVGRYMDPTVTLTDDDFLTVEVSTGADPNAPTAVAVTYTEPAEGWREAASGAYQIEDRNPPKIDRPSLFFVQSENQAARLAKRLAKVKRPASAIRATLLLIGKELRGQRFVRVRHAGAGIDGVFEIGELHRNEGGTAYDLSAVEVRPEDFDFDPLTEQVDRPLTEKITDAVGVPSVDGLAGLAGAGRKIVWSWDAVSDPSLSQILRMRETGAAWTEIPIAAGEVELTTSGLTDGAEYEAQVANLAPGGQRSSWSPTPPTTITAVENPTPPGALDAFAAAVSGSDVSITLTAPNDVNYAGTRIYRSATSTFADASLIHTLYGAPSSAGTWTDTSAGSGTWSYWGAAINGSGVEGTASPRQDVTL